MKVLQQSSFCVEAGAIHESSAYRAPAAIHFNLYVGRLALKPPKMPHLRRDVGIPPYGKNRRFAFSPSGASRHLPHQREALVQRDIKAVLQIGNVLLRGKWFSTMYRTCFLQSLR